MERNTNSVQCFIENGKYVGMFTERKEDDNVSEIVNTTTDTNAYFVLKNEENIPYMLTKDTTIVTNENYYGIIITTSPIVLDESFNYYLDDDIHTFFALMPYPEIDHETKMENPFNEDNMKDKTVMDMIKSLHMNGIQLFVQSEDENGSVSERPATGEEIVNIVKTMLE